MQAQLSLVAGAILLAFQSAAQAQSSTVPDPYIPTLPEVSVTAAPTTGSSNTPENTLLMTPAKVLAGDELHRKVGASLGQTLSSELGVAATGFGAGASRPIIRGLDGARIKILQNGMGVADVSSISNDHAVATDGPTARQIEILRGPAALLYGSGSIGGLVNVVNDRIPTVLEPQTTGETDVRYGTVDHGKNGSVLLDGAAGKIAWHVDGSVRNADDYRIPGNRDLNATAADTGRLPWSYSHQHTVGLGASYIEDWGYVGASVSSLDHRYGVPTQDGSQIDQSQTRYDLASLIRHPAVGIEQLELKAGYTDYQHNELDLDGVPQTRFNNRANEVRLSVTHAPLDDWHGVFGLQTTDEKFSALSVETSGPDTVPVTQSNTVAGFVVEARDFGSLRLSSGLRLESVKRQPVTGQNRSFDLASYSAGGLWSWVPGFGVGLTAAVAQRAPATEELYSAGPHDATATFDIGNSAFQKEVSHNLELSLQKTQDAWRWKINVFQSHVSNFIYGQLTGLTVNDEGSLGGDLSQRVFRQAPATLRGGEAEITYNRLGQGGSWRGFIDHSRGVLDEAGSLPLQPATRLGIEADYRRDHWQTGISVVHAQAQDRLAAGETETPAYDLVNAHLDYTQKWGSREVTWYAQLDNLLNDEIRYATSVLKDVAPQPGRQLLIGVRTAF